VGDSTLKPFLHNPQELRGLLDMAMDEKGQLREKDVDEKELEDGTKGDDDDMDLSSEDEAFFGDDGNIEKKEAPTTKEAAAEDLTGVSAAPDVVKKKSKKRKDSDRDGAGPSAKQAKTEQADVTADEVVAFITSQDVDMKTLVGHFKTRLKTKEAKLAFKAIMDAHCEVKKVNGNNLVRKKVD
jgi:hypothetical protein